MNKKRMKWIFFILILTCFPVVLVYANGAPMPGANNLIQILLLLILELELLNQEPTDLIRTLHRTIPILDMLLLIYRKRRLERLRIKRKRRKKKKQKKNRKR